MGRVQGGCEGSTESVKTNVTPNNRFFYMAIRQWVRRFIVKRVTAQIES